MLRDLLLRHELSVPYSYHFSFAVRTRKQNNTSYNSHYVSVTYYCIYCRLIGLAIEPLLFKGSLAVFRLVAAIWNVNCLYFFHPVYSGNKHKINIGVSKEEKKIQKKNKNRFVETILLNYYLHHHHQDKSRLHNPFVLSSR